MFGGETNIEQENLDEYINLSKGSSCLASSIMPKTLASPSGKFIFGKMLIYCGGSDIDDQVSGDCYDAHYKGN